MAQRQKTIARLVLQGICVLDILIGFGSVYFAIAIVSPIPRDNLFLLFTSLLGLGLMLALGVILIRNSYLMLRRKSFGVIKDFSVLVTITYFVLIEPFLFMNHAPESDRTERFREDSIGIAFLVSMYLVYLICVKLLKKLAEVAYGPEEISGNQNPGAESKENTNVEAT